MNRQVLIKSMQEYDADADVNGVRGGDYGHSLANAAYDAYGMLAFFHPQKRVSRDFTPRLRHIPVTKNQVPTEEEKQKMFDKIQRLEERALHGD